MAVDFSGLNDAVIDAFGETVTITVSGVDTDVSAVYFAPFEPYQLGDMVRTAPDHVVVMLTSNFTGTGADDGDYITVRTVQYQIVGYEVDEAGMVAVSMRK